MYIPSAGADTGRLSFPNATDLRKRPVCKRDEIPGAGPILLVCCNDYDVLDFWPMLYTDFFLLKGKKK